MGRICEEMRNIELELKLNLSTTTDIKSVRDDLSNIQRAIRSYEGNQGFSANGYFNLNRGLMSSVVGSLVTYLIVLLQFRAGEGIK